MLIYSSMGILVFGAAFDPPHNGHLIMAGEVVKRGIAKRVILVPCGSHAFDKKMSSAVHRLEMTKMLVDELVDTAGDFFEVSEMEINRGGVSYALTTLDEIAKMYPNDKVGWLMGSDQLANFDKWYKYEELLAKYPVYVYPREGFKDVPLLPGMIAVEDAPIVDVSSSQVRSAYLQGQEIDDKVSHPIAKYIEEERLWKK